LLDRENFRFARPVTGVFEFVDGDVARDVECLTRIDPLRVLDLVTVGFVDEWPEKGIPINLFTGGDGPE